MPVKYDSSVGGAVASHLTELYTRVEIGGREGGAQHVIIVVRALQPLSEFALA